MASEQRETKELAIPVFTLKFPNKSEFHVLWKHKYSTGTFLIHHDSPFPIQTEVHIRFLFKDSQASLLLAARVIQLLDGHTPQSKGMVVEFIDFQKIQEQISHLLQNFESEPWTSEKDFTQKKESSPTLSPHLQVLFQKVQKVIKGVKHDTLNQMLQISEKATPKEIRDVYLKLYQEINPHLYLGKFSEEQVELFKTARQKIKAIHDHFQDDIKEEALKPTKKTPKKRPKNKTKGLPPIPIEKVREVRKKEQLSKNKAKRLFEEALASEKKEEIHEAITNIRLAIMHDPLNTQYKKKLAELEKMDSKDDLRKNQFKIRALERELLKGKKMDWSED